jgi:DNA-binding response OmpR family regulator
MRQAGIHQPILILTAQHEELDKVLGLEIGADDYITKPYSLRELVSRIRAHLRRSYGEFSNHETCLLYFGEICIDLTRSQALRKEKPLDLTPIEFRLLTYLAQNGNRTVSRSQIINEVWGYTPDLNSEKTVNVHIRHLREKIEDDPESPTIIVTAPGIGYRLNTFLVD